MKEEEYFSDVIMEIQAGYLVKGCENCPFYGIEEYEIQQRCDGIPIHCIWWAMHRHFKALESSEYKLVAIEESEQKDTV